MLAHLVEIFIKDSSRVVPFTLRGLVNSIEVCMETFSSLYTVLRVQMPQNVDPEDGLIYDVLKKSEELAQGAQSARVLAGKLGRGVDEMKSRGLSVEIRHINGFERCYREVKTLTDCYRKVVLCDQVNNRSLPNYQKFRYIPRPSIPKHYNPVSTQYQSNSPTWEQTSSTLSQKRSKAQLQT
jgi:hypothetical protein